MGFVKEFKEFALKGNVMDLAIGVIIGAAFGKIVDSVVNDLIMPVIGIFFKADFSNLYIPLKEDIPKGLTLAEAKKYGPVFAWGNFISVVISFIILAFVVFLLVKGINRLRRKKEAPAEGTPAPEYTLQEKLLMEIRDSVRK
ncbi:MAG: large conductance mechanosensitive channel protein MscL [Flavisolibacter sp.]